MLHKSTRKSYEISIKLIDSQRNNDSINTFALNFNGLIVYWIYTSNEETLPQHDTTNTDIDSKVSASYQYCQYIFIVRTLST